MKTVLVATHQISFSEPESLYNCLGALTLSSSLKQRNLDCEVLDLFDFHDLYTKDEEEVLTRITDKILSSKPDVLGFSAMINNLPLALELIQRVKQINPKIHTIIGGPGSAFSASEVLEKFPDVDIIFRGESDVVFPQYIESLINQKPDLSLPGIVFKNHEGSITDNGWPEPVKDLDTIPFPDFKFKSESFISQTKSDFGDYNGISIETGRGCPFTCNFCSTSLYFKRKYRLKSPGRILDEIKIIQKNLGQARIIFNHDLFTLRRKHVLEICEKIKNENETSAIKIIWKCHARLDTLDEELLREMSDAGCNEVFVGLESATESMQKVIRKKLDIDKFSLLLDLPRDLKMKFSLSFIVGFPQEQEEDIIEIFKFCIKAKYLNRRNVHVKIHSLAPLVGSPLYDEFKEGLVYDDYGCIGTSDIPFNWNMLRNSIKPNPGIFSLYFHLPVGDRKRQNSTKFNFIGLMIEKLMSHSFYLAFEALGDRLSEIIVEKIDDIVLPPPASLKNSDYQLMAKSIHRLFLGEIENPDLAKLYDSMAQLEIIIMESKNNQDKDFSRLMNAHADPGEVLKIWNPGFLKESVKISPEKRFFMVFRDKQSSLKTVEISRDFAGIFS